MGASLAGEISGSRSRRGYRIATIGYATVVFAVLAGLAIGGALLAVLAFPNPFAIVIGVVMVGAAFVARPRPTPVPAGLIDRDRFPALFGLADRVADELHAHRVDGIRITNDFNASFGRYGWRGRRIISLGFPLITVLDGRQLVAVIAHEIAHDVNGDPSRQTYVGLAYGAVLELHGLLAPVDRPVSVTRVTTSTILVGVGAPIANTVMRGLSLATRPFVVAFEVLMRRQSQRAEYLADAWRRTSPDTTPACRCFARCTSPRRWPRPPARWWRAARPMTCSAGCGGGSPTRRSGSGSGSIG